MDKDIQNKIRAKYDPEKQALAQAWIEELTGKNFSDGFQESLKDGVLLCEALNKIKAGSVKKINNTKMAFKQRENIVNFLDGCKALGMKESDCFVTQDLFEGDNIVVVIDQLFSLGALSRRVDGFEGPYLGIKFADQNKREFSAEVVAAGKCAVPLQNSGSIAVDKGQGTDKIVLYGKVGQELGKASSEVSQQNGGSIAIEKDKGTDHIVRYGKVGAEMGKASNEVSQQNGGSIAIEKDKGTDHIVRYGKVGAEMGQASSATSQQNGGSIAVERNRNLDSITR